ncbi:MAG: iron chelate uptake ABC transporter family permease subunit, partial [Cyanobacteria bacterium J06629_9]
MTDLSFTPLQQRSLWRQRRRVVIASGLWLSGLALVAFLSLTKGSVTLTWQEFWLALWRQGDALHQTIVWQLRLPRLLAALTVGSALGLSGAMLQGMLRNGLASPFLLGISSGAGLAAVTIISFGLSQLWL